MESSSSFDVGRKHSFCEEPILCPLKSPLFLVCRCNPEQSIPLHHHHCPSIIGRLDAGVGAVYGCWGSCSRSALTPAAVLSSHLMEVTQSSRQWVCVSGGHLLSRVGVSLCWLTFFPFLVNFGQVVRSSLFSALLKGLALSENLSPSKKPTTTTKLVYRCRRLSFLF